MCGCVWVLISLKFTKSVYDLVELNFRWSVIVIDYLVTFDAVPDDEDESLSELEDLYALYFSLTD